VIWSGDNPSSLVGVGLVREGRVGISLGTSDTIFGLMKEPRVSATGTGHVFGAPTGDYMGLTCFSNGSLAREHVRDSCGLTWQGFSDALEATPPGNGRRVLVPWFVPEITPLVLTPGAHRCRLDAADAAGNVRAVVEGQMMAMALHSRWMGVAIDRIHATGGAAVNPQILQVMADVFGVEVRSSAVANAAALGAALRAWHVDAIATGHSPSWDDLVRDVAEPPAEGRVAASAARHAIYQTLIRDYETCQAEALRRRPNRTGFSGGGSPDLILHR
jgi:xylulokinase